nr:chromate efflux transporter [uncultured Halomonas sp.]
MSPRHIFIEFLKLGCVSFGGPAAHFGYFHRRFIDERGWLDDREFGELMALCQFLPGPASSQLGMALGYRQGGMIGSLAAFAGFTLPSALLMLIAGLWLAQGDLQGALGSVLQGLKLLAVAIVADAVAKLYPSCCPDRPRQAMALLVAIAVLLLPGMLVQLLAISLAALIGAFMDAPLTLVRENRPLANTLRPRYWALSIFAALLVITPIIANSGIPAIFDAFYRAGALVFGGGHVVLPLLDAQPLIREGMTQETFLAGYSLAQAVPGPMFSLAAYLGAALEGSLGSGVVALLAIFLPGWLLLMAILPIWERLRGQPRLASALAWVSAATVGLLMAALFTPVFTSAVTSPGAMAAALGLWLLLHQCRLPLWAAVIVAALMGLGFGSA